MKIHAKNLDYSTLEQFRQCMSDPSVIDGALMSDAHSGYTLPIGGVILNEGKVFPSYVGFDIGCLDKDTEFLTNTGWKKISNYTDGDKVLQYNKDTDRANFILPQNYIELPCEEFYHFKNSNGLDQMLSAEHKVLVWKGGKKRGYTKQDIIAEDLAQYGDKLGSGYYGIKASFNIDNEDGIDFSDNEIRLNILISADGHIEYKSSGKNRVYIHLRKERKIARLKDILNDENISYKETAGKDGSTHIYFYVDEKIDKDISKYWLASKRQLEIVREECLLWDGHKGYRSYFSTTEDINADIIQFAFSGTGIRAGISMINNIDRGWNDTYIVTPTRNDIIGITNTVTKVKSEDGKKYCFTVPTGYFIARRNGKIFITGNCGVCGAKTNLKRSDILGKEKEIFDAIYEAIPCGEGKGGTYKGQIKLPITEVGKKIFETNSNQIGTLGGGNHFIEIGYDEDDTIWVVVHSGSRGFGYKLGDYYMRLAKSSTLDTSKFEAEFEKKHAGVKKHNEEKYGEILQQAIQKHTMDSLKGECGGNNSFSIDSKEGRDYLMDMNFALEFALLNRKIMLDKTLKILGAKHDVFINKNHNCADILPDGRVLHRKGATSSNEGELGIIPGNMKEGCVIVRGKGNPEFLCCSSHGAGRIMSRSKADLAIKLEDFEKDMEGITALVTEATKDESRFAYKNFSEVLDMQKESIEILHYITPIINIKG